MFILISLFFLIILLIASALISAAEIGVTSLSKYRVKKLIIQIPELFEPLLSWIEQPYYLLTIIMTLNVVCDILTSFISVHFMANLFPKINRNVIDIFTWLLTSSVILVFGELVPKFYARENSEKVTVLSVPVLSKIEKVLKPVTYPVIKFTEFLSPKTSVVDGNSYTLSEKEVKALLSEGRSSGEIDRETGIMLERALSFDRVPVKKIMVPFNEIDLVDLSLEEKEFLDIAVETSRSRIPVYLKSKDNIVGYVHIKDILESWHKNSGYFVRSLVKEPYYVNENQKLNELLKKFQNGKTHIAFVKDENGSITGIVTLEDILEEIVGEILDEYDYEL
ncbi:MAG: hemolysin family protein [Endomicrobium sp.]|jgi:putative hemolysin|nr:hemolysin family protein [Endomicrobium sp.]